MKKFLNFSLSIIVAIILTCSLTFAEPQRWNFGVWHEAQFISGECKLETKDFIVEGVTLWTCEFKDGCLAGWISDITGAHPRNHRWITKMKHGRLT